MDLSFKITGIRLKEIRESSGLSATEVGKKLGKYHKVISSTENGSTDPSIMTLDSILSVFGLEFRIFFMSGIKHYMKNLLEMNIMSKMVYDDFLLKVIGARSKQLRE